MDEAIPSQDSRAAFITDQRLVVENSAPLSRLRPAYRTRRQTSTRAVVAASADIAKQIKDAESRYTTRSFAIDRQFPARVVATITQEQVTSFQQADRLRWQVESRSRELSSVGLLHSESYRGISSASQP